MFKKLVVLPLALIMFFLLTFNANVFAAKMDVENEVYFEGRKIQQVVSDYKNDRIYYVVQNQKYWEELVALDTKGNELWRYNPERYLEYVLFLQDDGSLIFKSYKAERIYTDGYNVGGTRIASLTKNGEYLGGIDVDFGISDIDINGQGNIVGYNSLNVYLIDAKEEKIKLIYEAVDDGPQNYARINDAFLLEDRVRIFLQGTEKLRYIDVNFDGNEINRKSLYDYNGERFDKSPAGDIIIDGRTVVDENGNLLDSVRPSGNKYGKFKSSKGILTHFKSFSSQTDEFTYYDYSSQKINKFNHIDWNYRDVLNPGVLLDELGLVYFTVKNKLYIRSNTGKSITDYEHDFISDIYIGDKLNDRQVILFSDRKLYVVNIDVDVINPLKEWHEWDEKSTNDVSKEWTVKFSGKLNPKTVSKDTIYVAFDKLGKDRHNINESVKVNPGGKSVSISRDKNWYRNETYYLFITDDVLSEEGKPLAKNIRMKFNVK